MSKKGKSFLLMEMPNKNSMFHSKYRQCDKCISTKPNHRRCKCVQRRCEPDLVQAPMTTTWTRIRTQMKMWPKKIKLGTK